MRRLARAGWKCYTLRFVTFRMALAELPPPVELVVIDLVPTTAVELCWDESCTISRVLWCLYWVPLPLLGTCEDSGARPPPAVQT